MAITTSTEKDSLKVSGYDPLAGLFSAQLQRPQYLRDVDSSQITSFERSCLVIDGTVTRFIEAYRAEPINVSVCHEYRQALSEDDELLQLKTGDEVIARKVLLVGRESQQVYVMAESLIALDRLVKAAGGSFGGFSEGMGRMLRNGSIEQHRELLWYGRADGPHTPAEVLGSQSEGALSRTYRIHVRKQPTMLITEWFNLND